MKKSLLVSFITLILVCLCAVYFCNRAIVNHAKGALYSDVASVPYHKVGVLLGTSKVLKKGTPNLYYQYRIDAATDLWKAGKIKYIIISGDNGRAEYNEPANMRADLMNAGVDSSNIFLDYAGFRTYDSMVRLKEIFSQDSATVISQQFHNERALYIAQRLGISAVGFNAKDVSAYAGVKTQAREKLARVKMFLDFVFSAKPKFLGEKILIP